MTAGRYPRITDPGAFGRVVVLMGGQSAERDISLLTGEAVLKALRNKGVQAEALDAGPDLPARLLAGRFDRVWIALHGRGGEDGGQGEAETGGAAGEGRHHRSDLL